MCWLPRTIHCTSLPIGMWRLIRNKCLHVNNMKQLFQDIHIDSIMTFLKEINPFNKI